MRGSNALKTVGRSSSPPVIDLRSDTSTLPPPEMLEAIRSAKLGNDGFGEDPTVNRLQEMAAKRLGKEAALFLSSGTQANLAALMCHAARGRELICERSSHIIANEVGYSVVAGLVERPVGGVGGVPNLAEVEEAILKPRSLGPGLFTLEDTHNQAGGTVIGPRPIGQLSGLAHDHGVPVHLDGSRLFNAAVALGIEASELARDADSVMFCLSKGLCAPAGSILAGTREFVGEARNARRVLGGDMRQTGILAACGIYALERMVGRLREDHRNARVLAESLARVDGVALDPKGVQTNIVLFDVRGTGMSSARFAEELRKENILVYPREGSLVRAVTHKDVSRDDVERTVGAVEALVRRKPKYAGHPA